MQIKIQGEAPFQVLATNFSISPSAEGYTLQVSADGTNFSDLFAVGANVTRMVTGVANGSYYRCSGNNSEIQVNWQRQTSEGGGGGTAGVSSLDGQTGALTTKTINNQSILGSGNIEVEGGSGNYIIVDELPEDSEEGTMAYVRADYTVETPAQLSSPGYIYDMDGSYPNPTDLASLLDENSGEIGFFRYSNDYDHLWVNCSYWGDFDTYPSDWVIVDRGGIQLVSKFDTTARKIYCAVNLTESAVANYSIRDNGTNIGTFSDYASETVTIKKGQYIYKDGEWVANEASVPTLDLSNCNENDYNAVRDAFVNNKPYNIIDHPWGIKTDNCKIVQLFDDRFYTLASIVNNDDMNNLAFQYTRVYPTFSMNEWSRKIAITD